MTKGTPSLGKRGKKKVHIRCKRCGSYSFHRRKKVCSACGYGKSRKIDVHNKDK